MFLHIGQCNMRLLRLNTVLVATDLDDTSIPSLQSAHVLAQAAGATMHVVHASMSPGDHDDVHKVMRRAGLKPGDGSVHVVAGDAGDAAASIGLLANELRADVIVVGPHRERRNAKSDPALGGTALTLATHVTIPCMVVARPLRLPLERVIVAVDLSDTARGGLIVALSWASGLRVRDRSAKASTKLTALTVDESARTTDGASARAHALEDEVNHVRRLAGDWAGVTLESAVVANENAAVGIATYASEHHPDLVVLGTRGLGLDARRRLGSVSAAAMHELDAPTLLVPPAVWAAYANAA
jgi:nucleotide-binding universal stress UspA family protein